MTTASATTTKAPKAKAATTAPAIVATPLHPTVTVGRVALKDALAHVGRAIGKSTLPVLSCVLLRVTADGTLVLSGTDLELGISIPVAATSSATWGVCVPHKLFSDIVGSLPGDALTIERTRPDMIRLLCGGFETTLNGFEESEFPTLPSVTGTTFTLPGKAFVRAIESVAPCVATDNSRPVLKGVRIRIKGQEASFTAADGFRLAKVTIPLDTDTDTDTAEIVTPGADLEAIAALFTAFDEPISVTVHPNGNTVSFQAGGITAITRIIEGKYPDADRIIPTSAGQTRATLKTAELANAFKLAGYFASSSSQISRAAIGTTALTLTANAASVGDQRAEVEATVAGPAVQIAFNVKFAAQITKVIDTPTLTIEVTSPQHPIVFRPVGDDQAIFLLMPMTLQ